MARRRSPQASVQPHPESPSAATGHALPGHALSGRRIRWERDPENSRRLIVVDALTGTVITVVRSLFEMRAP